MLPTLGIKPLIVLSNFNVAELDNPDLTGIDLICKRYNCVSISFKVFLHSLFYKSYVCFYLATAFGVYRMTALFLNMKLFSDFFFTFPPKN